MWTVAVAKWSVPTAVATGCPSSATVRGAIATGCAAVPTVHRVVATGCGASATVHEAVATGCRPSATVHEAAVTVRLALVVAPMAAATVRRAGTAATDRPTVQPSDRLCPTGGSAPGVLHEPPQHLHGLDAAEHGSTIADEGGDAGDSQLLRLPLVIEDAGFELAAGEGLTQGVAVKAQTGGEGGEDFRVADVLSPLEKGAEDRGVIVVETSLAARPMSGLVGEARAGLEGRQPHGHPQARGEWGDGALPGPLDVIASRVQGRNGLRAQLEGAPDDLDARLRARQLVNGWLRQPAKRSDVVGEDLYGHHGLIAPFFCAAPAAGWPGRRRPWLVPG